MRLRPLPLLAFALAFAWAATGCATAPTIAEKPAATARLQIANPTPYAWRVSVTMDSRPPRTLQVEPQAVLNLDVPPGECVIEQTLLGGARAGEGTRRFTMSFQAGEAYAWTLATLLSTTAALAP